MFSLDRVILEKHGYQVEKQKSNISYKVCSSS